MHTIIIVEREIFMNKQKAFTLAEVLITLGIIGIVAALTVPVLIQKYRKNIVVTQLKKSFSELSQALQLAESEHGLMEDWNFEDTRNIEDNDERMSKNGNNNKLFMEEYLMKYLKMVKKCEPDDTSCWTAAKTMSGRQSLCFTSRNGGAPSFITQSGYSVMGWLASYGNDSGICIDVDGPNKGAGIVGKDVFVMYIFFRNSMQENSDNVVVNYKKGIYLYGGFENGLTVEDLLNNDTYGCNKEATNSWAGAYCGLLIQSSGWKVPNNYPIRF